MAHTQIMHLPLGTSVSSFLKQEILNGAHMLCHGVPSGDTSHIEKLLPGICRWIVGMEILKQWPLVPMLWCYLKQIGWHDMAFQFFFQCSVWIRSALNEFTPHICLTKSIAILNSEGLSRFYLLGQCPHFE